MQCHIVVESPDRFIQLTWNLRFRKNKGSYPICIEDAFDIQFETDDIVDFNSFEKGLELLKKYDVEIA